MRERVQQAETTNVLLIHGTTEERTRLARRLHAAASNAFIKIDCDQEGEHLKSTLRAWISEDGCTPDPPALLGDGCSTLFLDAVEALSIESQRLLLVFLNRLAEATAAGYRRPIGRLIAGSPDGLEAAVSGGRFLPELFDALDKARVDLQSPSRW